MKAWNCCIIVTWWSGSGWIQAWSRRPTGFLQCFDTVGLVIRPVKIVPKVTYNVLSGTLNLYTTHYTTFVYVNDDNILFRRQSRCTMRIRRMTIGGSTAGISTHLPSRASVTTDVTRRPSSSTSTKTPTTFISSFLRNSTNSGRSRLVVRKAARLFVIK